VHISFSPPKKKNEDFSILETKVSKKEEGERSRAKRGRAGFAPPKVKKRPGSLLFDL
jgi:hypothetical protein